MAPRSSSVKVPVEVPSATSARWETSGEQLCIPEGEPDSYSDFLDDCIGCFSRIITVNSLSGAPTGEITPQVTVWQDYDPSYSATGAITFSRSTPGSGSAIFVVSSPGVAPTQVTAGPNDYSPDFLPDGTRIVFSHADRELGIVGVGGGPVSLLPILGAAGPEGVGYGYVEGPVFSPDGTRIAFQGRVLSAGLRR